VLSPEDFVRPEWKLHVEGVDAFLPPLGWTDQPAVAGLTLGHPRRQ
jgi:hypothetical protein